MSVAGLEAVRAPGTVTVREYTGSDRDRWDAYVQAHPDGTFFHLSGWRDILENVFGHRAPYLVAERDGAVVGLLPLGHVRSRLFGNSLASTPFCVYGGPLATDDAARDALLDRACALAHDLGVDQLELRNRAPVRPDWPTKDLYVTFRKEISADHEANLAAIPRKQRAVVRKGIASDLTSVVDPDASRLYGIYAESVRNLGTPVFTPKLFDALLAGFGAACEIVTIEHRGRAVASVLNFRFRDEILPYYGGGRDEARELHANDFMYWEVMRRAADGGVRIFDYGRSKREVGSYRFKKHWGFEPAPLHYEYHLVRARQIPEINPLNPKYRLFVEGWKKLPLPIARLVGPWLSRDLG